MSQENTQQKDGIIGSLILSEAEALLITGLQAIEGQALQDAKYLAVKEITKQRNWAQARLNYWEQTEPTLRYFHGKLRADVIIELLKADITLSDAIINALTAAPATT